MYNKNLKAIIAKNKKEKLTKRLKADVTKQLITYLENKYELRFNTILGCTELRPLGQTNAPFIEVDERMRNTLAIKARLDGIDVWDKDIKRFIDSKMIRSFNPVSDFLNNVHGKWDKHSYIEELAACVPTQNKRWSEWFHTWMLGMVAQWMGLNTTHGNSVAPLLISKQGYKKSTFCRSLLPPSLQWGYNDNLIVSEKRNTILAMSQYLLINIDEFNAVSPKVQEGFLKNILQLADLKVKRPYGRTAVIQPRLASFIATANVTDVLSDPSGCRRFLAIQIDAPIKLPKTINHFQLYAQAVAELEAGRRYWFNEEETKEIIENNRKFQKRNPLEDFFFDSFIIPSSDKSGVYMTASGLFTHIRKHVGSQLRLNSLSHFGRVLSNIPNLKHRHTARGTEYLVAART